MWFNIFQLLLKSFMWFSFGYLQLETHTNDFKATCS